VTGPSAILDPTGGRPATQEGLRAARLPSLNGKTLALLDNGKPNASLLLEEIGARLRSDFDLRDVLMFSKPSSGTPVEQTQMEEILATCDFAVVAVGD
jgi:hypothetical protein